MKLITTLKSVLILAVLAGIMSCSKEAKAPEDEYIKMETSLGTIVIDLFEAEAPLHAANYRKLARRWLIGRHLFS